jgi:hypothetical protein
MSTIYDEATVKKAPHALELFAGYDTFTGTDRAPAVSGRAARLRDARSYYSASVCTTVTEVQESLTVDGSASVSYGPLNVNAKADYVKGLGITATSVIVVVYAAKILGTQSFEDVAFDKEDELTPEKLRAFYLAYGDSFISSVTTGMEYWATYVFYATSEKQQEKIYGQLNGSAGWGRGKIDTQISSAVAKTIEESRTAWKLEQGMTGYASDYPEAEQIIKFAQTFPSKEPTEPAVVAFTTTGYEHAPGADPDVLDKLATSRDRFIDLSDPTSKSTLTGRYAQVESLANSTKTLQRIYDTYFYIGDTKLASVKKEAEHDVEALKAVARDVARNPVADWSIPATPSLGHGVPELNAPVRHGELWGGPGGAPFDGPDTGHVQERWKLTQIKTRAGDYVNQISLLWTDPGGNTRSQTIGEDPGDQTPLDLAPDEYITEVSLRSGTLVDRLTVKTNDKDEHERSWGGDGGEQRPTEYFEKKNAGTAFLGFYGRAGAMIDALGVLYADFNPALWNEDFLDGTRS